MTPHLRWAADVLETVICTVATRFCCNFSLRGVDTNQAMVKQRRPADQAFKGRQVTAEVILWAVRWYLMFPISYRDLELMLRDRGVKVEHPTVFRWIQVYAVEVEKRIRPYLCMTNGRVTGRCMYLYRAVDSRGQTIAVLLSAKQNVVTEPRRFRLGELAPVGACTERL